MKTFLFLIDAFRFDYLNEIDTPFLWDCAQNGEYYKKVIPGAGFCERSEIFTGQTPEESGFFTAIGYNPLSSPYRNEKVIILVALLERLLNFFSLHLLQKYLRLFYIRLFAKNKTLKPYNIPLSLLKKFTLTEDSSDKNIIYNQLSIFRRIIEDNKKYSLKAFTSLNVVDLNSDKDRIDYVIKSISNEDIDFYPIYISVIDAFGHKFGPNSNEIKHSLRKLDADLKKTIEIITKKDSCSRFIFLGDHGMSEVCKTININKIIKNIAVKNNLKLYKDYFYFLDSTLFRIWYNNESTNNIFVQSFKEEPEMNQNGFFLDEELALKYSIPFNNRQYGDSIWWANEGILIFPDFFHNTKICKGMHGYLPITKSTFGTCIVIGKGVGNFEKETIKLTDLSSIIISNVLNN